LVQLVKKNRLVFRIPHHTATVQPWQTVTTRRHYNPGKLSPHGDSTTLANCHHTATVQPWQTVTTRRQYNPGKRMRNRERTRTSNYSRTDGQSGGNSA